MVDLCHFDGNWIVGKTIVKQKSPIGLKEWGGERKEGQIRVKWEEKLGWEGKSGHFNHHRKGAKAISSGH